MEKKEKRSLAYLCASKLDPNHLTSISGGAQKPGIQWCSRETMKASGYNIHAADVVVDFSVDF